MQPAFDARCSGAEPPTAAVRGSLGDAGELSVWVCTDERCAQYRVGDVFGPLTADTSGLTQFQELPTAASASAVLFGAEPKDVTRVVVHLADGRALDASPLDVAGFGARVWFAVVPGGMVDARAADSYADDRLVDHQGPPHRLTPQARARDQTR